ncbi:MAG TPA: Asp-tRNA(Asn)/Glu-tRNA(Gln) amidotransferase subunit GatC [Candidatus Saccharimonadales bacterium]|nr:Asp-tRNA(Asn)/Glu-tRNA(Gln) amidotransferase subunit GatC [Candidatus Saccharimonadales bacterium]
MRKLTRDDVLKLARLARLRLSDQEIDEYSAEISSILQYVEMLQGIEVGDTLPTNQVSGLTNVMRSDEIIDYGYAPDDLLKNVPSVEDSQLKVRRMLG